MNLTLTFQNYEGTQSTEFEANIQILTQRSDYFKAIFSFGSIESMQRTYTGRVENLEKTLPFFGYLRGEKCHIAEENVDFYEKLAKFYVCPKLIQKCIRYKYVSAYFEDKAVRVIASKEIKRYPESKKDGWLQSIAKINSALIQAKALKLIMDVPEEKRDRWVESLSNIPFNQFCPFPHDEEKVNEIIHSSIFGNESLKKEIVDWIKGFSEGSKSNLIVIKGSPRVGKEVLARNGIAKALGRPFFYVSLEDERGEVSINNFTGYDPKYDGAPLGKFVEYITAAKCMNPVFFLDEFERIPKSPWGKQAHQFLKSFVTSLSGNKFISDFFLGIEIDLSKAVFIIPCNDTERISKIGSLSSSLATEVESASLTQPTRVELGRHRLAPDSTSGQLLDRLPIFETRSVENVFENKPENLFQINDPSVEEKVMIAKNYLLPEIKKKCEILPNDVDISDELIRQIIERFTGEKGVGNLKEHLFSIFRGIHLSVLMQEITFPFALTEEYIDQLFAV